MPIDPNQIIDILNNLNIGQAYVWPLVNDNPPHYKFYNILARKTSHATYRLIYIWGKIETRGKLKQIDIDPDDAYGITMHIYNTLRTKTKKGYRVPQESQYHVITEQLSAYTLATNTTYKAPKTKKKLISKQSKSALSKRFNDLIME